MKIFTSAESHYSVVKSVNVCGFGTNNLIKVKCDETGRMDPVVLEEEIKKCLENNEVPLMVNATLGTTV